VLQSALHHGDAATKRLAAAVGRHHVSHRWGIVLNERPIDTRSHWEKHMTRHTLVLLAAGAAGWMMATTALAGGIGDVATMRVSYADLDLMRDTGVERLYARLRRAADSVCGDADIRDLLAIARKRECMAHALDGAIEQAHSAKLTARHAAARPPVVSAVAG
jgi:UrcA family protein